MLLQLIRLYRRLKYRHYGWHGNYAGWQQAQQQCTGYNASDILEKVRIATLKVKNGEAVYERDSILFDHIEYSWPLLANLLWIALHERQQLSVIDFGGSLGSSYFQNRNYLQQLPLKWSVVEQHDFVTVGRQQVADDKLQFFYTIDEALSQRGPHHLLLLSCVLPYLEDPYDFLQRVVQLRLPFIIVDNTYFNSAPGDRLTVQKVAPVYYDASYPAWFLDYEKIKSVFAGQYELVSEYMNDQMLYLYGEKINYRGFFMKLKNHNG